MGEGPGSSATSWDSLDDGAISHVFRRLGLPSLLHVRQAGRRCCDIASQPMLWRDMFQRDFPAHYNRQPEVQPAAQWPQAYQRRHATQQRWREGPATCTELTAHTGPVFSVLAVDDPLPHNSITISGGVFGYGEVSELYQWNRQLAALPLEWAASAQLGGVIALTQRLGRRDVVIGGFAGCAQVVSLEDADVDALSDAEVNRLAASLLPETWLATPREELEDHLRGFGAFYTANHTHTLHGHAGAIPGAAARADLVVTSGFDGATHVWRPQDSPHGNGGGAGSGPAHETPVTTLVDADGAAAAAQGPEGSADSQSVCSVVLTPDCTGLYSGCNDHLVRVWDVERRTVTGRLTGHSGWVWCLEEGPSPGTLISGATDGTARLWDTRAGQQVAALRVGTSSSADPTQGAVAGTALRPDKRALVCGSFDTLISVVDLRTWRLLHSLKGHGHRVTRVSANDDGVLSASFDSTLRHWAFDR